MNKQIKGAPADAKAADDKRKKEEDPEEEAAINAILAEIEGGLRDEQLEKLWAKYKGLVLALAIGLVAFVAAGQAWQVFVEERRVVQAEEFETASRLVAEQNWTGALDELASAANKGGGYAAFARLEAASVQLKQGELEAALSTYRAIADDSSVDPLLRDVADLLWALHGMDTEDPTEVEAALQPLLDPSSPFYHTALELSVVLAQKQGDIENARSYVETLLTDPNTPFGARSRAQEMAALLGVATSEP